MRTSARGLALLKGFEALRLRAYRDSAGVWTCGYGHTGDDVTPTTIATPSQADRWLKEDLALAEHVVAKTGVILSQLQFDALVSLVFNIGGGGFARSTLVRKLKAGDYRGAADQFLVWTKVTDPQTGKKKDVKGLATRRFAERALFLEGTTQ